jgi:hypothetical protein
VTLRPWLCAPRTQTIRCQLIGWCATPMAAKIVSCCGCLGALLLCCSLAHLLGPSSLVLGDEPRYPGFKTASVAVWECDCSRLNLSACWPLSRRQSSGKAAAACLAQQLQGCTLQPHTAALSRTAHACSHRLPWRPLPGHRLCHSPLLRAHTRREALYSSIRPVQLHLLRLLQVNEPDLQI